MTESPAVYLLLLAEPFWVLFLALALGALPVWGLAIQVGSDSLTRLLLAVVGSCTLMYLAQFGAYLIGAPQWVPVSVMLILSLVSVVSIIRRRAGAAEAAPVSWDGVATWAALAVWILGMQSRIVVYGGAGWFGDWYEHYERALFFLDRLPAGTRFMYGDWTLPARGPLFNASAALVMGICGKHFWVYQTVATALNTFAVVPMGLLVRDIARIGQRWALTLSAVIFGLAPFAVQQQTYTWTKFFTLGFILGGIHLYRLGLRQGRPSLVGLSFGTFTAGILSHYLTVPFAAFFACHFAYTVLRRHWNWRVVGYQAMACLVLLATWFGYLVITFGVRETLAANSTIGEYSAGRVQSGKEIQPWHTVFIRNLAATLLPYSWRHTLTGGIRTSRIVQIDRTFPREFQPSQIELNRKTEWFEDLVRNAGSIPGALGWAGVGTLLIAAASLVRARRAVAESGPETPGPEVGGAATGPGHTFWVVFFLAGIPLNVLLSASYQESGVVHLNLQPFLCLAAVFSIRWLRDASDVLKFPLLGMFLVESALTTGAILALQGRQLPLALEGATRLVVMGKVHADQVYVANYIYKLRERAVFLSDRLGDLAEPLSIIAAVMAICLLVVPSIRSSDGARMLPAVRGESGSPSRIRAPRGGRRS